MSTTRRTRRQPARRTKPRRAGVVEKRAYRAPSTETTAATTTDTTTASLTSTDSEGARTHTLPEQDNHRRRARAEDANLDPGRASGATHATQDGTATAGEFGFLAEIAHPRARAFLRAYSQTGNVTEAARAAGVSRKLHYYWLEHLPGYREAAAQAEQMAADALEREAWRRAVEGWDEPVYQKGQLVGTVRRYSDVLMTLLLRGLRPERYRERVDIGSEPGRPVLVSDADAETARRLIEVMAARRGLQQGSDRAEEPQGV